MPNEPVTLYVSPSTGIQVFTSGPTYGVKPVTSIHITPSYDFIVIETNPFSSSPVNYGQAIKDRACRFRENLKYIV
jgi:hypothetical protein